MEDLRNHLFAALEGLADKENPLEIERARAICNVAQTVINSAKVEVEYLEVTGQEAGGKFFAKPPRLNGQIKNSEPI